jgi:hypothetical protein
MQSRPRHRRSARDVSQGSATRWLSAVMTVGVLTVVSYLPWLGWDQQKTRVPGTTHFEGRTRRGRSFELALTHTAFAVGLTIMRMPLIACVTIWSR